mgnify:CR=1 FL=1
MLQTFNTLIKPDLDHIHELLGISHTEDWTVIPVRVKHASGTTVIVEDGIVTDCDHAGAELGQIDLGQLQYNPTTGQVETFDNVHVGLACDRCPAWQDETGEWND